MNYSHHRSPFDELRHEITSTFGFNGRHGRRTAAAAVSGWAPPVDIKEEADRFVIYADLPGFDPQHIDITFDTGVLIVKGERAAPVREELEKYSHLERPKQSFERRFRLPDTANPDAITARGEYGVLEVVIGKKPVDAARKIAIK